MNLTMLLVADFANITKNDKLNILGIFSEISAPSFPFLHHSMVVIGQLEAGPAEYGRQCKVTLKLISEDGEEKLALTQMVNIPNDHDGRTAKVNSLWVLNNVLFEKAGEYEFAVLVNDDQKGTLPFSVKSGSA